MPVVQRQESSPESSSEPWQREAHIVSTLQREAEPEGEAEAAAGDKSHWDFCT